MVAHFDKRVSTDEIDDYVEISNNTLAVSFLETVQDNYSGIILNDRFKDGFEKEVVDG